MAVSIEISVMVLSESGTTSRIRRRTEDKESPVHRALVAAAHWAGLTALLAIGGVTALTADRATMMAYVYPGAAAYGTETILSQPTSANVTTLSAPSPGGYPAKLSPDKTHLVDQNDQPAFIVGEAAWSLITQLSDADVDLYLSDRKSRGFNAIWVVAADNVYQANPPLNYYGDAPFDGADFTNPNPPYWAHVDHVVQRAAAYGITVMLHPAFVGLDPSKGFLASYENSC